MDYQRMNRRRFLAATRAVAAAMILPSGRKATAARKKTPNVLIIVTDDQGWGDIHSHGNDQIDTPVMDALAASGARFDRFYVSPVCAPTRASLLTGRYHLRTGVTGVTHRKEIMRSEEVTLAEVLRGAGYATGCSSATMGPTPSGTTAACAAGRGAFTRAACAMPASCGGRGISSRARLCNRLPPTSTCFRLTPSRPGRHCLMGLSWTA